MNADLSVFIRVIRVYNYRAMKATLAILLLLFLPQDPGVEVLKSSWSKIRIGWERDPFSGPLENFDEMRSRARNERRVAVGGGERAAGSESRRGQPRETTREGTIAVLLHLQNQA